MKYQQKSSQRLAIGKRIAIRVIGERQYFYESKKPTINRDGHDDEKHNVRTGGTRRWQTTPKNKNRPLRLEDEGSNRQMIVQDGQDYDIRVRAREIELAKELPG